MTIVGCRIDGRLIHGQVANLWAGKLNVSRIMVVDDEVVNNDVEKSGLKLATPPGVKLSILPIEKAAANILAGKYDSQRLFIVARKPDRFLGLVEAGASNHLSAFRLAVVRPCHRLLDAVDQLLHAVPTFAVAVYSRA